MSGNQYVYVVELDERLRSNIKLVTKNRKEAFDSYMNCSDRLRAQGFTVMDHFMLPHGKTKLYVKPGSRDVCIRMIRYRKQDVDVVVRVTAWVIKWGKEEVPRVTAYSATGSTNGAFS